MIDEHGIERTVATPQHEWEPPRLFPGTRTINARWRLALLGFPLHWLDLAAGAAEDGTGSSAAHWNRVGELAGPNRRVIDRWWNKQGVVMTGNAQNPRVVEALARAMIAANAEVRA